MRNKQLPLLTSLIDSAARIDIDLEKTLFVCVQHLVDTTVYLFQALIDLGAIPQNVFLLGKHYSQSLLTTHQLLEMGIELQALSEQTEIGKFSEAFIQDVNELWKSVITRLQNADINTIIILDDGGHCLTLTPKILLRNYNVVGIEQTTRGLQHPNFNDLKFPIIQVASSAAKQKLESPVIAEAVARQIKPYLPSDYQDKVFGVVGVGAIGQAVINKLIYLGCNVLFFDSKKSSNLISTGEAASSLKELIESSDILIGCTGTDIFKDISIPHILNNNKLLISCSSEDKEFLSLLNWVKDNIHKKYHNPLADITFSLPDKCEWKILRGGFPINFSHEKEVEPESDIQLTRALLLGGILQAIDVSKNNSYRQKNLRFKLDPYIQQFLTFNWVLFSDSFQARSILPNFKNIGWIKDNSSGINTDSCTFKTLLSYEQKIFNYKKFVITEPKYI